MKGPLFRYPDPKKPFVLFTYTSTYAWAQVLTKSYEHKIDGI